MMYRFLIVDDEYYIRQHIRCCIPWENYDFQYAGEASSVSQAMEFLEHNGVELILLDISYGKLELRAFSFLICGVICFGISFLYNRMDKNNSK